MISNKFAIQNLGFFSEIEFELKTKIHFFMNTFAFFKDNIIQRSKMSISPDDRGYLLGDGIYEVMRLHNHNIWAYDLHYQRLVRSLQEVSISYPQISNLHNIINELIRLNGVGEGHQKIYIQITRGDAPRIHRFPSPPVVPNCYVEISDFPLATSKMNNGISVITSEDIRWLRCDIKSINLLPNVMLNQKAFELGADEVFLVRNGVITEGTHNNIFGVKNNTLYTHPVNNLILKGVTRSLILEIAAKENINVLETPISLQEINDFEEFFVCGTGAILFPVTKINNLVVGDGKVGKMSNFLGEKLLADLT